jgi:hypothetical protein
MKGEERGLALVESVLLGVLFLVPVLWMVAVLSDVHRGALAATSAAREAGFEAARSFDRAEAARSAESAVGAALRDHGLDPSRAKVFLGTGGLGRGDAVEVRVSYPIDVLRMPLIGSTGPSIWIRARHVARVDPYRSLP